MCLCGETEEKGLKRGQSESGGGKPLFGDHDGAGRKQKKGCFTVKLGGEQTSCCDEWGPRRTEISWENISTACEAMNYIPLVD